MCENQWQTWELNYTWNQPRPDSEIDLLFQLNMQLVKVNSKVMSLRGSKVSFGMDRDVWVVSFVHEERQDTGCSVWCIVVGEFGKG